MLTIAAVKAAQPAAAPFKLFDGGGLFLYVAPTGLKSWRQKYRIKGKEKLLTFGRWPEMSLPEARLRREAAKERLRQGIDPGVQDQVGGDGTFEGLARDWHRHGEAGWSPAHADEVLTSLERDVFPEIGASWPGAITPAQCLAILQKLERRDCIPSARRMRHRISSVFRFGMAQGVIDSDPAAALRAAMRPLPLARPMPALIDIEACRALLAGCESIGVRVGTALASRFLALTAVRLNAVRGMRWAEVDRDNQIWTVPASRMKLGQAKKGDDRFDHAVPLSAEAMRVLDAAAQLRRDDDPERLVFTGRGGVAAIGEGAIRELYNRAGYAGRHVPHGWRASFSTIMNETMGPEWRDDIDRALAHSPRSAVEAAYNRAQLLDRRRYLMERWGAMLG